jgi:hypothetical protein
VCQQTLPEHAIAAGALIVDSARRPAPSVAPSAVLVKIFICIPPEHPMPGKSLSVSPVPGLPKVPEPDRRQSPAMSTFVFWQSRQIGYSKARKFLDILFPRLPSPAQMPFEQASAAVRSIDALMGSSVDRPCGVYRQFERNVIGHFSEASGTAKIVWRQRICRKKFPVSPEIDPGIYRSRASAI